MGENTKISWATHTFNPIIGCTKVSDACKFCYAATDTFVRVQRSKGRELWGDQGDRHVTSEANWKQPLKWNREAEKAGERRRVFCASLSDVFEDRAEWLLPRLRLFQLITQTPHLDWLLLTKRPEGIRQRLCETADTAIDQKASEVWEGLKLITSWLNGEAPPTIWLGTTVENQEYADKRIPELLKIPARVRFLSCEPLLGPIDLTALGSSTRDSWPLFDCLRGKESPGPFLRDANVHWVIGGGESGPDARFCYSEWARSLRDQCALAGVAFHWKQWGSYLPDDQNPKIGHGTGGIRVGKHAAGCLLDGREHKEMPEVAQ